MGGVLSQYGWILNTSVFPTEMWELGKSFFKRIILSLMNCFDTNARKREILDHLEVRIQILFSWVWENFSSLCNPSHVEK